MKLYRLFFIFTMSVAVSCASTSPEHELVGDEPALSMERLTLTVGQTETVSVLNAVDFTATVSDNEVVEVETVSGTMAFMVRGVAEGQAAVEVRCGVRPAPLWLPVEVVRPEYPLPFESELADPSRRITGGGLELRFDAGGVLFEERLTAGSIRAVRLSDGMTATFVPGEESENGQLPDAVLTINGVVRPLAWAQHVSVSGTSPRFYNLTDALTGRQIVIVF